LGLILDGSNAAKGLSYLAMDLAVYAKILLCMRCIEQIIYNGVRASLLRDAVYTGHFTRVHCCLGDQHRTFQWPGSWRFMAQGM